MASGVDCALVEGEMRRDKHKGGDKPIDMGRGASPPQVPALWGERCPPELFSPQAVKPPAAHTAPRYSPTGK